MLNFHPGLVLEGAVRLTRGFRIMSKKCKLDAVSGGSIGSRALKDSSDDKGTSERRDGKAKYEFLVTPEKSPTDKKDYSVIRLKNGLTALLVTDHPVVDLAEKGGEASTCSSESGRESDSEGESESSEISESESAAGDGEEKIAACALCVGVGSFSDPPEIQGLAHFLEHMVFMGSNKYPAENAFDSFIKRKGGSDNASTQCEQTTFYLECQEEHLHEAMDMFSQFFISPLMKYEAMSRERQAVESEFRMALPSDAHRRDQLLSSLASENNPVRKFMWGNLETLRDNVEDNYLHKSLHEFRERHYSAHRMTLAVQARLSQEVLADLVHDSFSQVGNNGQGPLEHHTVEEPFSMESFHKLYYIEPVNDICEVELTWSLPPTLTLYKVKPLDYLSWLIGHEGSGGLVSHLRRKVWALGIVAGEGDEIGSNSLYSLFSVKIQLTEEGYKHIEDILNSTFAYIKMLQDTGPDKRIYDEIKAISDMDWGHYEESNPIENVEALAESMQLYPPEHYLSGSELHFEYSPEEIQRFLSLFTPTRVNIMVSSKRVSEKYTLDQTEKWFGTKFTSRQIPDTWLQAWTRGEESTIFHLPHPNPFIPTDLSILPVDEKHAAQKYPRKILSESSVELWFKEDVKFKLPQAYMYFYLTSPLHAKGPLERCMVDVFTAALGQLLTEETYPASVAQMGYTISCSDRGLTLLVYGFNQNLHLLLDKIITGITDFSQNLTEEMFEAIKRLERRYYTNQNLKAGKLATDLRMMSTVSVYWSVTDRLRVLDTVTYQGLKDFSKEYFSNMFVNGLVQGNLTESSAANMGQSLATRLVKTGLAEGLRPRVRVCRLNDGETCISARSFNSEDVNCVTTLYYQDGPGTIKRYCIFEILQTLLEEPLFDTLRTKEQLGYDVSCSLRDSWGILGFSLTVISQRDKLTVEHVRQRMESFLTTSLEYVKGLSNKEFQEAVTAVIKLKQYSDVHLKEEASRNWGEIKNQEYVFDRLEKEVELLSTITLDEVHELLQSLVEPASKKLVVQVVSEPSSEKYDASELHLLSPTSSHVTDIPTFKQLLQTYPPSKIDH